MPELTLENLKVMHLGPIDLVARAAEVVCLSGRSGAGKSLLLRSIADIIPYAGQVLLDDRSSLEHTAPHWRKQVALLPAESQWWQDSVGSHYGNIDKTMFGHLDLSEESLQWQVSRCSTGEKQRLAILRVLANKPKCLLLDEPTGSLDPENTKRVERLIKEIAGSENIPVLWVSHSEEQIERIADRHLIMHDGGIIEQ